jgi:hypothetical protein
MACRGRDVLGRVQRGARGGEGGLRGPGESSDAEVHDLHARGGEQHVRRLDVAVHDADRLRRDQRPGHVLADAQGLGQG